MESLSIPPSREESIDPETASAMRCPRRGAPAPQGELTLLSRAPSSGTPLPGPRVPFRDRFPAAAMRIADTDLRLHSSLSLRLPKPAKLLLGVRKVFVLETPAWCVSVYSCAMFAADTPLRQHGRRPTETLPQAFDTRQGPSFGGSCLRSDRPSRRPRSFILRSFSPVYPAIMPISYTFTVPCATGPDRRHGRCCDRIRQPGPAERRSLAGH